MLIFWRNFSDLFLQVSASGKGSTIEKIQRQGKGKWVELISGVKRKSSILLTIFIDWLNKMKMCWVLIPTKSWITRWISVRCFSLCFHKSLSWQQNHCSGKVETYHCSTSLFKHGRKHAACEPRGRKGSMSAIVLNRDAPQARLQIENEEVCAQGGWVQRWLITISHAITRLNWVIPS